MRKSIPPISEKTFSYFCAFVNEVTYRNESGSVIGLSQREQGYRINQLAKNKPFNVIDLKNNIIDDPDDLQIKVNNNKKTVLLISNADCLFEEKRSFLTYFNDLVRKNDNLSYIFLFQRNITYPWNIKVLSSYQYLFQNVLFYPKYREDDLKQFFYYLEKKFKSKVPVTIKNSITKACDSNLWLIKEAVRYYTKTRNVKKLFDHEEMIFRLKVIFDEFDEKEKQVLKKIAREEQNFTDEEKSIYKYLNKTNLLAPLLIKFIFEKTAQENILTFDKDKKIILNSISIDSFFSRSERKGLRHILSFTNKLIPRDELAKILWSDSDDYTDWALDQFIRRLRNKLKKLGLNKNLLKTIKNQGFLLKMN